MAKRVNFVDCSLRDGHQSLLATRMSTNQCLRVLPMLKESGYSILELWGGATLDSALRFTNDDPFERLAAFYKITGPDIQIRSLCRGQNLFGYTPYPDNVVFKFIQAAVRGGNKRIRIFDALNDARNLNMAVMATKTFNGHAEAALSYTTSPVHDQALFVRFAVTAIDDGAPAASSNETTLATSAALSTFGTTIASAPELAIAATSALPHAVPSPLQRMAISRLP